ncbi:MAG: HAMP domain-containing histidine kinase [Lachnospiraceae bacterium]|nr:HAMP domain-containing histidine kinase [Lachnospiraceae bacterium]
MIKALRKKFILITMVSVLAVLTILIGSIDILNYYNVIENIQSEMSLLKDYDGNLSALKKKEIFSEGSAPEGEKPLEPEGENQNSEFQQGLDQGRINQETPFSVRYFTVVLDENGVVQETNTSDIAAVSEEEAKSIATELFEEENTSGFYNDFAYDTISVELSEGETGTMYIFLNSAQNLSSFRNFRNISLIISIVGLALVFALVLVLSKIAIKPVAESYEKQKHFITDASHEIKTPLAIIEANTEVLEMTEGDNEWLQSIRHQIERLSSLTEKLVFLSRMDEENTKLEMAEFSLSKAVSEVAESFLPVATAKEKTLEIDVAENISMVGNEGCISQVVSLLVDNAMKYSNEGGLIDVSLKLGPKNRKEIVVYNTVDEIEVGNHDVLFERFYRSDSSRSTKTGGHGIGLSVVKAIVTAHKGKVTAESQNTSSIIFRITLP